MLRFSTCLLAPILASSFCACSFNRNGVDVPTVMDAGRDAGRDAGPPDSGPPDAGPPDSGPPSCVGFYGEAPMYQECEERATECEFYIRSESAQSCSTVCQAAGGRCLSAYDNFGRDIASERCIRTTGATCDDFFIDILCICSRGP